MKDEQFSLYLAVEGPLDEFLLRKLLVHSDRSFSIMANQCGGCTYLKSKVNDYNRAAKGIPFLVLTDLDQDECAPEKIRSWFSSTIHPNFLFRIAVRSIEAWFLADREGISSFMRISERSIPVDADGLEEPKQVLINLARKSKSKAIREGIVPPPHSTSKQGPGYNGQMISFIKNNWDIARAEACSNSLRRTLNAIRNFKPDFYLHRITGRNHPASF